MNINRLIILQRSIVLFVFISTVIFIIMIQDLVLRDNYYPTAIQKVRKNLIQENVFCIHNNRSFNNAAKIYLSQARRRKECDHFNGTNFVFLNEHQFYNKKSNKIDFKLLETLEKYNQIKINETELSAFHTFYSIKLNIDELKIHEKFKNFTYTCEAQLFEKFFSISENLNLNYTAPRSFTPENDYTLYFEKHGYYYVYCHKESNRTTKIYEDSFLVLPKNMSKLVDERKEFQKREIQGNNLTYEADNDDKYLKLLDSDNKLSIDKKMNVLMLGFDSLSYHHFQRIMPKTFNFLTKSLENNVMFTSMNRVGENTHPNILAMLSGIFITDIPSINITSEFSLYRKIDNEFYDKYPLMWYRYERNGYLTGFQVYDFFSKHQFNTKFISFFSKKFLKFRSLISSKKAFDLNLHLIILVLFGFADICQSITIVMHVLVGDQYTKHHLIT
jgi:hypothetical protein